MSTLLNFGTDVGGRNSYAPSPATDCFSATLIAGSASSFTVPSNYKIWTVNIARQSGCDIWVNYTGNSAAAPSGSTFSSVTSVLNPSARSVAGGATISVFTSNATCQVGIELYAVA